MQICTTDSTPSYLNAYSAGSDFWFRDIFNTNITSVIKRAAFIIISLKSGCCFSDRQFRRPLKWIDPLYSPNLHLPEKQLMQLHHLVFGLYLKQCLPHIFISFTYSGTGNFSKTFINFNPHISSDNSGTISIYRNTVTGIFFCRSLGKCSYRKFGCRVNTE